MLSLKSKSNSDLPCSAELNGLASLFINDMYDDYDLDDFGVGLGINIKRFEPIGFSFKMHREEGSLLTVYCVHRKPFLLTNGDKYLVKGFQYPNYSFEKLLALLDSMELEVFLDSIPIDRVDFNTLEMIDI